MQMTLKPADRGRIALYFLRFVWMKPAILFAVLLLIAVQVAQENGSYALLVLVPVVGLGGFLAAQVALWSRFDDEVYDRTLAVVQRQIEGKARDRLDLRAGSGTSKVMTLIGFSEHFAAHGMRWLRPVRAGRDRRYRFLINQFTVVMLSSDRFTLFRCHYDPLRQRTWGLSTIELGYEQITSIQLFEDFETADGEGVQHYTYKGREFLPTQVLALSVAGSPPIRLAARARPAAERKRDGSALDETVMAIRNELRDRIALPAANDW
ncbi:MAG: hypothetical protein AAGC60_16955 [Acidobacteriota bacterium]